MDASAYVIQNKKDKNFIREYVDSDGKGKFTEVACLTRATIYPFISEIQSLFEDSKSRLNSAHYQIVSVELILGKTQSV